MTDNGDIGRELDRALEGHFTLSIPLHTDSPHRYIILSDQHKGAGDRADEFVLCKPAYHAALDYYRESGYSLVLLGDVEELWEQSFPAVERAHSDSLKKEASFGPGRYFRIWGNHDDEWMVERSVRRSLAPYMPTNAVYEGIRFEVLESGASIGTVLLVHGHQGTFGSDKIKRISRWFLRIYRYVQRLTGIGQTTPSRDACLRGQHDRIMYEWAASKERLILIAGHTHRAVWSSQTHLQQLHVQRDRLFAMERTDQVAVDLDRIDEEIRIRQDEHPPCNDTVKPQPAYFNTGCCKYSSGSITGIEIEDGRIRLIRWGAQDLEREVLETADVALLLDELGQKAPASGGLS
ncbi:MAG: hypothetical protein R2832_17110 [Rhodothermales bacterium]